MKAKELFLETLKPEGKPERALVQYEALAVQIPDPVILYMREGSRPGTTRARTCPLSMSISMSPT